jgi:hypothetical protein
MENASIPEISNSTTTPKSDGSIEKNKLAKVVKVYCNLYKFNIPKGAA